MGDFVNKIQPFEYVYQEFHVDKAKRLGHGGFGKVYLITSKKDNNFYAAKYQKLTGNKIQRLVRDEAEVLECLSSLHHPSSSVMIMYGYYEKNHHSLLVTEYLKGGELFAKISDGQYSLTEKKCCGFVKQIVRALNYIHERGIVHLDIKPQNIMLRSRDLEEIKLIDFGLAKKMHGGKVRTGFVGTIGFMAPEVLNCTFAEPATDFFSLGVVTYMLLSGGYEPFWYKNEERTIKRTLRYRVSFEKNMQKVSHCAKQFMEGLLEKRVERRLSGASCLSHPWLLTIDNMEDTVLDTARLRGYMARTRWAKAIKAVRFTVKMQLALPDKTRPDFHSQEIPVLI